MSDAAVLDPMTVNAVREVLMLRQRGDIAGARKRAEAALGDTGAAGPLRGLLGMLCCEAGDLPVGIAHLRIAQAADPTDMALVANLATALVSTGASEEAELLCTSSAALRDPSLRLARLRAHLLQERGAHAEAAALYRRVVVALPDDFESWNNLGSVLTALGDHRGALDAIERAIVIKPDIPLTRLNFAAAYEAAGNSSRALEIAEDTVAMFPSDPVPLIEIGGRLARLGRTGEAITAYERAAKLAPRDGSLHVKRGQLYMYGFNYTAAEESFRAAIAVQPAGSDAYVELAILYEHINRIEALAALIAEADAASVDTGAVQFLRALDHWRAGRFAEGAEALAAVPETMQPVHRAQFLGQLYDRLGNANAAFAAFGEMNRIAALDSTAPLARAESYRQQLRDDRALVTSDWYRSWSAPAPALGRPSPVFLVGFPRSGTTLLDTMLLGHPRAVVLEEVGLIVTVENAGGTIDRIAGMDAAEIGRLREVYFAEVAKHGELKPDSLLIDKNPMQLTKLPIIHRLFPDARIILALRHPCDTVLSCYITAFRLNNAMANFLTLETAAETYDLSFGYWEQCRATMPLDFHAIHYENMVADAGAELRPLFDFLGLDWREETLDHQRTAAERGNVRTASYAQVTEPLYKHASGRWRRYAPQLASVMTLLSPWIARFGYSA